MWMEREQRYGACLATVEYGDIYNGPVNTTSLPGVSRGHMIRAALLNPEKGTEIALKDLTTKMAFNISAESVNAQKLETSKETNLQCFGWTDNRWSQKACVNGQHKTGETHNYMTCECNQTTYVKIFAVNKTEEPVTEIPENTTDKILVDDVTDSTVILTEISNETTQTEATEVKDQTEMTWKETKRYISARFDGNFTEVVGENNEREEKAKEWMTEAIARRINVSSSRMKNINITEGSVDYEAYLVDDESLMRSSNENSADEASAVLAQLIAENFVIEGPNGERLTAISDPPSAKEKESFLPILIGGIVGGVLLICFVFVVLAIYYHTKKKKDKVTALDRSLKSGSGSHADSGFGNDEDVPDAFQYKTPTKEQLDRTGPIPEHVVFNLKNKSSSNASLALPGMPSYNYEEYL
ncbi:hypothetical protein Avbf_03008 [Armadillidium vulgare]|nr:hypothetical protein Avbf_03008 [Armadillidium vulgare]